MKRPDIDRIKKNRILCIALLLEVLLIVGGIISLFGEQQRIAPPLDGSLFSLKRGTYLVHISYSASQEGNVFVLEDGVSRDKTVLFGTLTLSSGYNTEDCELWVVRGTDTVSAYAANMGDPEFQLKEFEIVSTKADSRMFLFVVLLLSLVVDGLLLFWQYDREVGVAKEKKLAYGILALALLLVSIPCMVDYNLWGDDWGFHLLRVEGLINGLQDGQFPVRIQGNWLRGYGYAVSIFYSDFFMVIPMLFRLIGFPVLVSYQMFLFTINVGTLLVAYQCFRRCFLDVKIGAVAATLYTMSAYRLHNLYMRASIGETLAMTFLPLVFYGFYKIFTEDIHRDSYQKNWIVLTLGLTGVIQSHVLTCEMLAFCVLLLCVILIKKVFLKETFLVLAKTVIVTLLLNLWYLVPFVDYLMHGKFNVGHLETMKIKTTQEWGIYPTHALFLFYGGGTRGGITSVGMNWTGAFSVGVALIFVVFVWGYLEFTGRMKKSTFGGKRLGRLMFGYSLLLGVLTSCYFPWDALQNSGAVAETLITSLQFPYRFLSVAGLTTAVLAGELMLYVKEKEEPFYFNGLVALLLGIVLVFGSYQMNSQLVTRGFARVYNKQSMGTIYVSNGEYLPYQSEIDLMQPDRLNIGGSVNINAYEKGQYTLQTDIEVTGGENEGWVELPLLYYQGYDAVDKNTGEHLRVCAGTNGVVRVLIPAHYSGEIHVWFHEPLLWRVAEIVSVGTLLGLLVIFWIGKKKTEVPHEAHVEG